ncbi:MAG: gamma-glutamylcyclotransferase [Tabrizicola sp.]|nr:gamma-glutamylcyclotransferase [Tabrizicola sp.]
MRLTPDHVARVHRVIADAGPLPGVIEHSDADYAEWVDRILRTNPAPGVPIQLFAFGSLIWRPEIDHRAERLAVARGWHRSFCLRMNRFRATVERPGLMMALDRGGQCRGVILELSPDDPAAQLDRLFRREFTVKPINNTPRWLTVDTGEGRRPALGFVMNRASPYYAGRLPVEEVARILAGACGHWGSCTEYLLNTVTQLEARGIRDRGLWRLQALVADEIERNDDRTLRELQLQRVDPTP